MKKYSDPKLIKYEGADGLKKTWYVYFRYKQPDGSWKVIKRTAEMNRISDYKERLSYGNILQKAVADKLKKGWNPLVPDIEEESQSYTLYQAIEYAFESKRPNLAPKTIKDYSCTIRFVKTAISELGFGDLLLTDTKRTHIKLILKTIKDKRKWSNNAYNKALNHIQAVMSELVIECEFIEYNPAHKIKVLPTEESVKNAAPSEFIFNKIKSYLSDKHPEYWVFILMIKNTGIRPVELTRITLNMIDPVNRIITLPAHITKNRKRGTNY